MSVVAPPEADRSTALQQGTKEFAGVYERHAYLVYNLALRIAADRDAAIETACAAFLASLGSSDAEADLPRLTVRRGIALAKQTPTPEAAGDADAQAMLRATAVLAPPERAALALIGVAKVDAAAVGRALDMTEEAAGGLVERAWSSLAKAASLPIEAAKDAYESWLWAEPPAELWELLYPSFYAELVRRVSSPESADHTTATAVMSTVAAAIPKPSRKERRRARRAERDARRSRPPGRVRRAVRKVPTGRLAGVLVVAGIAAGVAYLTGAFGGTPASSTASLPGSPGQQRLSPTQIAQLRLQEQQAERDYLAQQRAARQQQLLQAQALRQQQGQQRTLAAQAAAQQRQAALKRAQQLAARQKALQQQLLKQAQLQQQSQSPPAAYVPPPVQPAPTRPAPTHPTSSGTGSTGSSGGHGGSGGGSQGTSKPPPSSPSGTSSPTPGQAQQQCLYDANSGQYVCPQQ
jgi:hypothetical protein